MFYLRYACSFCEEKFAWEKDRQKHERRKHTFERPFLCNLCGRQFMTKYDLRSHHYRQHLNIPRKSSTNRQHYCSHCPAVFVKKYTLVRHVERKHSFNGLGEQSVVTMDHDLPVPSTSDHEQPQPTVMAGDRDAKKSRKHFSYAAENDGGECSAETVEQAAIETLMSLDHDLPPMLGHQSSPLPLVTTEQSASQSLALSDHDQPELTTVMAGDRYMKKLLLPQNAPKLSRYGETNSGKRSVITAEHLSTSEMSLPMIESSVNQLESVAIAHQRNGQKFSGKHTQQDSTTAGGTEMAIINEVSAMPSNVVNLSHIYPQSAARRNVPRQGDCSEATSKPAVDSTGGHKQQSQTRPHYCPHCELACTSLVTLSRHVRTHFGISD